MNVLTESTKFYNFLYDSSFAVLPVMSLGNNLEISGTPSAYQ